VELPPPEMLELPSGLAVVQWRRSARARRVSLRIDPRGGAIVITLPMRATRRAGMALLMNHTDWLADRLAALPDAIRFADGAIIPIAGEPHRIRHAPTARGGAFIQNGELIVTGAAEFLRRRAHDFLYNEAGRRLGALVAEKSALAGLRPKRITVKDTKSRWGSCAADGSLSFSWRLVMAPRYAQDYVAAHEVAHLRHMNHGAKFWALVDELTPHKDAAIAWLRNEAPRLLRIG
jgi:predicted metal-dependent hydrolase